MEILVKWRQQEVIVPEYMINRVREDFELYKKQHSNVEDYLLDSGYDAILGLGYDGNFDNDDLYQWFRDNDLKYCRTLAILLANAAIHYVHDVHIMTK